MAVLPLVLFWLLWVQNLPEHLSGYASDVDPADFGAASIGNRVIKLAFLAVGGALIFSARRVAGNLARRMNLGMVAFLVLAISSTAWSISRGDTVLRFVSQLSIIMMCIATCTTGWHPRRFQQLVIPPLFLLLASSLVLGLVAPDLAIEYGDDIALKNSWHGITHGKNEFGMLSSIATIFFVHRLLAREGRRLATLTGIAVSFTCLILSRSNTSLFACLLACNGMFLLLRSRLVRQRYTTHLVVGIVALVIVYELTIQRVIPGVDVLLAPIFKLTGKDATFSARTIIWQIIKDHIQYSPWIGTGFGAYWIGAVPNSPSYVFLSSVLALYPTESHNGYLEVMNDLGVLGLACLALFIGIYVRQALLLAKFDRPQATLACGLLFHQMVMTMSESDWFSLSATWAIIALSSLMVSRALAEAPPPAWRPLPGAQQSERFRP
jgi:O-antigen ligase